MTDYLGFNVLETAPNAREAESDTQRRNLITLDPGLGMRRVTYCDDQPKLVRPYLWTCKSKAEIVALKDWLALRKGRAVPFWVPSWRKDLLLAVDVGSSDTGISIVSIGYTRNFYPAKARQHLAFLLPGTAVYRQVINAIETSASEETLTIASPLGLAFAKTQWICFLHLMRLASDDVEISHITDGIAEATLQFVEVPEEAP